MFSVKPAGEDGPHGSAPFGNRVHLVSLPTALAGYDPRLAERYPQGAGLYGKVSRGGWGGVINPPLRIFPLWQGGEGAEGVPDPPPPHPQGGGCVGGTVLTITRGTKSKGAQISHRMSCFHPKPSFSFNGCSCPMPPHFSFLTKTCMARCPGVVGEGSTHPSDISPTARR